METSNSAIGKWHYPAQSIRPADGDYRVVKIAICAYSASMKALVTPAKAKMAITSLLACFGIALGITVLSAVSGEKQARIQSIAAGFDSVRWKQAATADFGKRKEIVEQASRWVIGKPEAELLRILGEPETKGVGGLLGVEWQPEDGSKAWNYNVTASANTSHLGNAFRVYIKNGHAIRTETITTGCN